MKILVVDDSAVLRAAVTKLMSAAGYQVVAAEDGVEGIIKFYEERPNLVLLDLSMPRVNGYVVCRVLKDDPSAARVPLLVLTARNSAEDRYWAERSGADGFLTKDELGEGLLARVRTTLATQALASLSSSETETEKLDEADVMTKVSEVLDRHLFQATVANDLSAVGVKTLDMFTLLEESLRTIRRLIRFDIAAFSLVEERRFALHLYRPAGSAAIKAFKSMAVRRTAELAGSSLEPADLADWRLDGEAEDEDATFSDWSSTFVLPLTSRNRLVGTLALGAERPNAFSEHQLRTLRPLGPTLTAVVESARSFQAVLTAEATSSLRSLSLD